jgi:hypothetical protein
LTPLQSREQRNCASDRQNIGPIIAVSECSASLGPPEPWFALQPRLRESTEPERKRPPLFSNKSAAPPIPARRRHRPSPLHLPDHGEMVLDDREGIRRCAPEDWAGAAPFIARQHIDRLNMSVELLTEIGSIECRTRRHGELPQKPPVRRVQNGWRRAHSVPGEHRFVRAASAV